MDIIAAAVFLLGSEILSFFLGQDNGEEAERKRAIQAGVARYTVDSKTGETTFEYIKPTK